MERDAQQILLRLAREAVEDAARARAGSSTRPMAFAGDHPDVQKPAGAFVTLHARDGSVRGCVGTTATVRPLNEVVADMARAAALRDPRFSPVSADEVTELVLEISVLDPAVKIESLDDVVIGRDGLMVIGRGCRGVLLPQVAEERGWDAATFAENTCRKAGLNASAYEDADVDLFRFAAEVFSEVEPSAEDIALKLVAAPTMPPARAP